MHAREAVEGRAYPGQRKSLSDSKYQQKSTGTKETQLLATQYVPLVPACSGATTGNLPISEGADKPSNLLRRPCGHSHSRVQLEANLSVARRSQQWTPGVAGSFSSPARTGGKGRCPEFADAHVKRPQHHCRSDSLCSGTLAAAGAKHTKKPRAATRNTLGWANSRQEKGGSEPKSD